MNQPTTLLQGMPWTPSCATNVQATWEKHGWKPRAETVKRPIRYVPDDYELVERTSHLDMIGEFAK